MPLPANHDEGSSPQWKEEGKKIIECELHMAIVMLILKVSSDMVIIGFCIHATVGRWFLFCSGYALVSIHSSVETHEVSALTLMALQDLHKTRPSKG